MDRFHQSVLILATLAVSWLGMQAVHELGHVAGAMLSGGKMAHVVLHPATISYTRLAENPSPVFVAWMGPVVGVVLPLVAVAIARLAKLPGSYLVQFFAGFCLVANGAYLGFGSFNEIGDAGELLQHGAPIALLWLFAVVTIPIGFWLWNDLGPHFGLGTGNGQVNRIATYVVFMVLVALVLMELVWSYSSK
jgi:hypothetical protein